MTFIAHSKKKCVTEQRSNIIKKEEKEEEEKISLRSVMIRDTQDFTIHVGECRAWWIQSDGETNSILDRKKFSPKLIFNEGWWDKRKKKKLNPGTRDPTNSSPSVSLAKLCIESHRVVLESSENESLRPLRG